MYIISQVIVSMVEVVTYANKSFGLFEELVHNEFDVPVKVLGWGRPWNGYSDKSKALLEYINESKSDDDLIVFVDGFDSKINKDPKDVKAIFDSCGCKVLFSRDPESFSRAVTRAIFPSCSDAVANAGMYAGYAKYLKIILEDELSRTCQDDQVNFNDMICKTYDFIKIDKEQKLFENIATTNHGKKSDAIFVSYPATLGIKRSLRSIVEYLQYLYVYILLFIFLMFPFPVAASVLAVLFGLIYIFVADKSCGLN
jgi:hypothetical protein